MSHFGVGQKEQKDLHSPKLWRPGEWGQLRKLLPWHRGLALPFGLWARVLSCRLKRKWQPLRSKDETLTPAAVAAAAPAWLTFHQR